MKKIMRLLIDYNEELLDFGPSTGAFHALHKHLKFIKIRRKVLSILYFQAVYDFDIVISVFWTAYYVDIIKIEHKFILTFILFVIGFGILITIYKFFFLSKKLYKTTIKDLVWSGGLEFEKLKKEILKW